MKSNHRERAELRRELLCVLWPRDPPLPPGPPPPYSRGQCGTTGGLLWPVKASTQRPRCLGTAPWSVPATSGLGKLGVGILGSSSSFVTRLVATQMPQTPQWSSFRVVGAMSLQVPSWLQSPHSRLPEASEVPDSNRVRRGEPQSSLPKTWDNHELPSICNAISLLYGILFVLCSSSALLNLCFLPFSRHSAFSPRNHTPSFFFCLTCFPVSRTFWN